MPTLSELITAAEEERAATPSGGAVPGLEAQAESIQKIEGGEVSLSQRIRERQQLREQGISTPSVLEVDEIQRQQFLSSQVGGGQLGEPGFEDTATRIDIGFSDIFAEKKAKFLDSFPEGDFVQVQEPPTGGGRFATGRGGATILFRRNQGEPFAEFDAGALDRFELLGDLADISGDVPAMAGEVGMAILTQGSSLPLQIGAIAAGTVAGDVVKETMQEARDFLTGKNFQLETLGEAATRIGARAGISAVGTALSPLITGPLNIYRGAALMKVLPGAPKAQQAAKALQVPALLPNQIARNPLVQRIGQQSQATVSTLSNYVREQEKATVQAITRLRDEDALKFALGNFKVMHDAASKQILAGAKAAKTSLTEGGTAIQYGLAEYNNFSRAAVNEGYARARQVATPDFDLAPALAVARELKVGSFGAGKTGQAVSLQAPTPAIAAEIKKLESLNPSLPTISGNGVVMTGTDQLRALRSNFNSLKSTAPAGLRTPEERLTNAQANTMFFALDRVLKNPKNADPKFVEAWKEANDLAAKKFATEEKLIITQATKSETPAQMADRLAKPLQVDNLQVLKDTLPEEQFKTFQNAVETDFIAPQNIDSLTNRLKSFDGDTLDLLMDKGAQDNLRKIGRDIDQINQVDISGILQRQSSVAAVVRDLTDRKDTAAISELIKRANQLPPGGNQKRIIRAGIVEDIFDKSVVRRQNEFLLNGPALETELKRLRDTGLDKILTKDDNEVLSNLDDLIDFLPTSADSGTSLQSASLAAGIREGDRKAFITLLENMTTGRVLTNRVFQRVMLGTGAQRRNFSQLRVMSAILGLELADFSSANEEAQQPPPK